MPKNQTNGQQGEFRGPHYDGWREELQSGSPYDGYAIRYSDERIWKPGTPGYKAEYEKKFGANLIWWSTQDSAFENWATLEGWDPRAAVLITTSAAKAVKAPKTLLGSQVITKAAIPSATATSKSSRPATSPTA